MSEWVSERTSKHRCHSVTIQRPFSCQSKANRMSVNSHSSQLLNLPGKSHLAASQSQSNYCHFFASLLPFRCQSTAIPLPVKGHSVANQYPFGCQSTATHMPVNRNPSLCLLPFFASLLPFRFHSFSTQRLYSFASQCPFSCQSTAIHMRVIRNPSLCLLPFLCRPFICHRDRHWMPLSPSKASSELHSNAIFTSFLCHSRLSELLTYFVNILTNDACGNRCRRRRWR